MKSKRIRTWVLSGALYLTLVVAGYFIYVNMMQDDLPLQHDEHAQVGETSTANVEHGSGEHGEHPAQNEDQHQHGEQNQHTGQEGHGEHGGEHQGENEVIPRIEYDGQSLVITLKDTEDSPVKQLEVNHEKLMHLILVSEDLQLYEHLHPEQIGEGIFHYKIELAEGQYRAFVDIKPTHYGYHVEPIPVKIGEQNSHHHAQLEPSASFTASLDGKQVTLNTTELVVGEPVTLDYQIEGGQPEPYLGALGHVVILDEQASTFIHVHPMSDDQTSFQTQFDTPGLYKVWGEFQFDGQVYVYPFVLEVK